MLSRFAPSLFESREASVVRAMLGKEDRATPEEIATAARIINDAPVSSPLDIARYFESLTETNADGFPYNAEWPRSRENPVIIAFFLQATDTAPYKGDETPWCAAFVNWCLMRAGRMGTRSASSGSFRCTGNEAGVPTSGDIAVFKNRGQDEECRGNGHVAFLVGVNADQVRVLGGNQRDRVKESTYTVDFKLGQPVALMSIRALDSIP